MKKVSVEATVFPKTVDISAEAAEAAEAVHIHIDEDGPWVTVRRDQVVVVTCRSGAPSDSSSRQSP